jgi:hypothetical protein
MSDDTLRDEILGDDGFANWLRGKQLSGKALAEQAQARIQAELGAVSCANVNDYLCRLLDAEYEIYLETERELIEGAVEAFLTADDAIRGKYPALRSLLEGLQGRLATNREPREALIAVSKSLAPFYKLLTESFAQSRKTRAGGSAQYQVEFILNQLGYQGLYERQRKLNGTVDFLFPSLAMWEKDRRRCTVLSVKRTLRERYKQVFEELSATRGLTMYLMSTQTEAEAQKDITAEKVQVISQQNVYLVVRDAIKKKRFARKASVLGFTDFFCKELPRLRAGWTSDAGSVSAG